MTEWWTYSLRDLLLFSPQTYYRLFELYNIAWWPLHVVALALGISLLVMAWRGGARAGRSMAALLALSWLWVAWAFHSQRYASINLAAEYFAWAFAAQGMLLLWLGGLRGHLRPVPAFTTKFRFGLGMLFFALALIPVMGVLTGRSWTQAEVVGMAPDPTVLATLGTLLLANERYTYTLYPIPVAWCLISGTTLWAIEAPDFAIMPVAALLTVGLAVGYASMHRASRQN